MIAKAAAISHGINDLRYISGESVNKEHPELIFHVKDNLLPCELDAMGIWDLMKASAPMKKNVIRMEISLGKEHTGNFTLQDWQKLWDDFVREFDRIELADETGKVYSHKTDVANSIYTVWVHYESDSGIPHLHAAVCRKDCNGRTNNDHNIHMRAQEAAEKVAIKRGWITAAEIHRINVGKISDDLMDILRAMPSWSWEDYVARIRRKGYTLSIRPDRKGGVYGYSVGKGNSYYKASELGTGRKLTASRIEDTWNRLHRPTQEKPKQPVKKAGTKPVAPVVSKPIAVSDKQATDYTMWRENTTRYELPHNGKTSQFYIPNDVMQVFDDAFDYRYTANWQELTDMAVALFVGLTALDTVSTGSGGAGSSNDDNWRDRKDEDEMERARRCARAAAAHLGKQSKSRRRR